MRQKEGSERCNQYSSTVGIALCTAPPPLPIRARGRAERDYFFLADFEKGDFPSFLFLEKDGHTRDGSGEIACWVVIRRVRASKECISGVTRSLPPDFVPKNARERRSLLIFGKKLFGLPIPPDYCPLRKRATVANASPPNSRNKTATLENKKKILMRSRKKIRGHAPK